MASETNTDNDGFTRVVSKKSKRKNKKETKNDNNTPVDDFVDQLASIERDGGDYGRKYLINTKDISQDILYVLGRSCYKHGLVENKYKRLTPNWVHIEFPENTQIYVTEDQHEVEPCLEFKTLKGEPIMMTFEYPIIVLFAECLKHIGKYVGKGD